jgi:hypothetical protein
MSELVLERNRVHAAPPLTEAQIERGAHALRAALMRGPLDAAGLRAASEAVLRAARHPGRE